MKKLVCAALILGTLITPACLYSDKVSAAPYTDPGSYAADEVAMPNCIGYHSLCILRCFFQQV
ncbi:MAG: hypothetical protein J6U54_02010 [Clostridiales bacterium]|nr:hypothetical protein [Clostridiales bacterium]